MAKNGTRVGIDLEQSSIAGVQVKGARQGLTLSNVAVRALPAGLVFEGEVVDVEALGAELTRALSIPTIGIGASPACDGQILVIEDMLGLTERAPKFAKRYANLEEAMRIAVERYADEVRAGKFPEAQHCFAVKKP